MDKKNLKLFLAGLAVLLVAGILILRLTSPEDDWICDKGEWVKHGNPSAEKPSGKCPGGSEQPADTITSGKAGKNTGMANPASVNCGEKGGKSEIKSNPDGSQYGVCVFDDGRECDEWEFFRSGVCGK
jgi:putative hemolysin